MGNALKKLKSQKKPNALKELKKSANTRMKKTPIWVLFRIKREQILGSVPNWSGKRDSNSRPRPWQGRALPTELFPLKLFGFRINLLNQCSAF